MALTQENVHYTLKSGPGVMNKSNRVHARIQEFLSGGGGGGGEGGSRPDGQKLVWTMFFCIHQLILQFTEWIRWFYYRGEEGVQLLPGGGGVQRNRYNVIFQGGGGPDPLTPLWIRTWGRLTPLFAYRIMVYQNLNKTEKIPPKDD